MDLKMAIIKFQDCLNYFNKSNKKPYYLDCCEHQYCLNHMQELVISNTNKYKIFNVPFINF